MNLFDVCTSDLVILKASATVAEAARLMRDRHVGCVIVFGDTLPRRPVGIITDRDIVIKVVADEQKHASTTIGEVMSTDLVVSPGTTGIYEAVTLMSERGVRRLLVMDDAGHPKGIVSFDDLLRFIAKEQNTMAPAIASGLLREENRRG